VSVIYTVTDFFVKKISTNFMRCLGFARHDGVSFDFLRNLSAV